MDIFSFEPVAYIHNGFTDKFGIPRQSGLASGVLSEIVFEKKYSVQESVRDIEQYSHLWLIWLFSKVEKDKWEPTVRPPRLGGNRRVGVFATRSPYRPNPIGLSCVKLESVKITNGRISLVVSGADILDGTPILDIKPYVKYSDSHPEANSGFSDTFSDYRLNVDFPETLMGKLTGLQIDNITDILSLDPRPGYQDEPQREYHLDFDGLNITFTCDSKTVFIKDIT